MFQKAALSIASVLLVGCDGTSTAPAAEPVAAAPGRLASLEAAVAHAGRTPANVARDRYRNPAATLNFFEVDPSDTVVELWPGNGWYTEVLAPYLAAGGGKLYGAAPDWGRIGVSKLQQANPALYGAMELVDFPAFDPAARRVPDGTADVVLTFRNVHNWRMGYRRDDKQ